MLREAMHRNRTSFKQTLNAAVRAALSEKPVSARRRPFVVKARPMHLQPGLDPGSLNRLADELEMEDFLRKAGRAAKK
jgi:hypothetical protein